VTELPKISIIQRESAKGALSSGYNSIVMLNGEPLQGVSEITIDLKAGKIATAKITLIGQIEAKDLPVELVTVGANND